MKKEEFLKMTMEEVKKADKRIRAKGYKRIEDSIENGDVIIERYDTELMDWNKI